MSKVCLIVIDGWGISDASKGSVYNVCVYSMCAEREGGRGCHPLSDLSCVTNHYMAAAVKADVANEIRGAPAALALAYRFLFP